MPVEHLTIEDPKELMEIISKELEGIEKGLINDWKRDSGGRKNEDRDAMS